MPILQTGNFLKYRLSTLFFWGEFQFSKIYPEMTRENTVFFLNCQLPIVLFIAPSESLGISD